MKKILAVLAALALTASIGTTAFAGSNNLQMYSEGTRVAEASAYLSGYSGHASTLPENYNNTASFVIGTAAGVVPTNQPTVLYDSKSATRGAATIFFSFGEGGVAKQIDSTHTCLGATVSLTTT